MRHGNNQWIRQSFEWPFLKNKKTKKLEVQMVYIRSSKRRAKFIAATAVSL